MDRQQLTSLRSQSSSSLKPRSRKAAEITAKINRPEKITIVNTIGEGTEIMSCKEKSKDPNSATLSQGSYNHLRYQMTPATSTCESDTVDMTTSLGALLLKLPQEIRDMILSPLLASGHPQFLRASKAMNTQGMSLISKYGIYRINIGFGRRKKNCPQLTQPLADTVRNIHFCVNMRSYPSEHLEGLPEKKILRMFTRKDPGRRSCSVTFEGAYTNNQMVAGEVLACLTMFKEFAKVTLSANIDWIPGQCFTEPTREWFKSLAACCRTRCFAYAREYLEPTLGTAYRVGQGHCDQMVFYPHCFNRGKREYPAGKENGELKRWVEDADDEQLVGH